jgi:fucose 4-O-acetylase-like acetyltransferase
MVLTTAAVLLLPIAINRTGFQPYGEHEFWRTDPYYFFFRLGNVMLVLTALMGVERVIDRWKLARFSLIEHLVALAETVGQETLIVYVAHLMVLHGSVLTVGLQRSYHQALSLNEAIGVTVALTGAMIVLAASNAQFKRYRATRSRRLVTA